MNKININLRNLAEENLEKYFKVIIVYSESLNPEELLLKDCKKLMRNIVSGFLKGQRILELSMHEKIVSIEEDINMSILKRG